MVWVIKCCVAFGGAVVLVGFASVVLCCVVGPVGLCCAVLYIYLIRYIAVVGGDEVLINLLF